MSAELHRRVPNLLVRVIAYLKYVVPRGRSLSDDVWRRRHRTILALLWLHAAGVVPLAVALGFALPHALFEGSVLAAAAAAASWGRPSRTVRAGIASFGLLSSSAILVHLSGGYIELHFHFFVMVGLMALYQDWVPFLLAIGYVVLHHGVVGVLAPQSVYNHPAAWEHPWRWAGIHGAFVLVASAASLTAWRLNEFQALHDPLTKLANRVLFKDRVEHALAHGGRSEWEAAVLFLDLDDFKNVNDRLGHNAGDKLLIAVAARLKVNLRPFDTVARLGGDEFAILLDEVVDAADAARLAERLNEALRMPFDIQGHEIRVSSSIGISLDPSHTKSADALVHEADLAMYSAKRHGKARYELFRPDMHRAVLERLELEADLRRAVEAEEFVVHYQPVVSFASGDIAGFEALVRWAHPTRGLLAPGSFIPLAEETGLILPIGRFVLHEACRQARAWQTQYPTTPLTMSVNLSGRQLQDPRLVDDTADALSASGVDPSTLILEITETVMMREMEAAIRRLEELKELGVRLAVDDFGTGYSSLSYLRRFPIDILKIDKSFIQGATRTEEEMALAQAIIGFGATLDLETLAEGIETAEHRDCVGAMNCDLGQGFFFARPVGAAEAQELLRSPSLVVAGDRAA